MYLLHHPPPDHPPRNAVSENGKPEAEFNGKTVNPNQEKSGKPKAGINGKNGQSKSGKYTSKVNRFGKWSTFSENGKPESGINGKNGQSKTGKVTAEGFERFENQTLQPLLL